MKDFYTIHSKEYIEATKECDLSHLYHFFEQYLNQEKKNKILDLGFGSGRDSLYFLKKGYDVTSLDSSLPFYEHGKEIGLKKVLHQKMEEMNFNDEFDAIWANASLLHIKEEKLNSVFIKCSEALKENGILYCSFKYGSFIGIRDERYYHDLTEETLKNYLKDTNLIIKDILISRDIRTLNTTKWLNIILKKQ